jgi:hypothetical protein
VEGAPLVEQGRGEGRVVLAVPQVAAEAQQVVEVIRRPRSAAQARLDVFECPWVDQVA